MKNSRNSSVRPRIRSWSVDSHVPPGVTIEEFGREAMRQWGVGHNGDDNGAILFVFTDDKQAGIEIGKGHLGALSDAKAKWIVTHVIKPHLTYWSTVPVEQGVDAMMKTIRGEPFPAAETAKQVPFDVTPLPPNIMPVVSLLMLLVYAAIGWVLNRLPGVTIQSTQTPSRFARWMATDARTWSTAQKLGCYSLFAFPFLATILLTRARSREGADRAAGEGRAEVGS
jgi:uncharacterized membrane protein YgcG